MESQISKFLALNNVELLGKFFPQDRAVKVPWFDMLPTNLYSVKNVQYLIDLNATPLGFKFELLGLTLEPSQTLKWGVIWDLKSLLDQEFLQFIFQEWLYH